MISLMDLPYGEGDLSPYISAQTVSYHYGKHHQGYVDTVNKLIQGTLYETLSLEEIIIKSYQTDQKLFNNAAQVWNHNFYWQSLSPIKTSLSQDAFSEAIDRDFQGLKGLISELATQGLEQFGSGWSWLVKDSRGKLSVRKTSNADLPWGYIPLLVCDVWEHAYYLDYQNRRKDYLETILNNLLNWPFAQQRYHSCQDIWQY